MEVKQRILRRNDGCVRREPPLPSCGHYTATVPHTLCKYGASGILWGGGQVYVCIRVRGSEVDTSAIITLYLFSETESLLEPEAHQSD